MLLKSQLAAGLSCLWEGVEGTASEERGVARAGIGKAEQGVAAAETFYGFEMWFHATFCVILYASHAVSII